MPAARPAARAPGDFATPPSLSGNVIALSPYQAVRMAENQPALPWPRMVGPSHTIFRYKWKSYVATVYARRAKSAITAPRRSRVIVASTTGGTQVVEPNPHAPVRSLLCI